MAYDRSTPAEPGQKLSLRRRFGSKYRQIPSPHHLELAAFGSGRDRSEFVHTAYDKYRKLGPYEVIQLIKIKLGGVDSLPKILFAFDLVDSSLSLDPLIIPMRVHLENQG